QTYVGIGLFCLITIVPLAQLLRARAATSTSGAAPAGPAPAATAAPMPAATAAPMPAATAGTGPIAAAVPSIERLGISSSTLLVLLCIAGVACCVAMSMPQVHIVAYCGDLGYGPARGAEMLS